MLMTPQDMHTICKMMAQQLLMDPLVPLFAGCNVALPTSTMHDALKSIMLMPQRDELAIKESQYPAHDGFIVGQHTLMAGVVQRKGKTNAVATAKDLLICKPVGNGGFDKAWPGPLQIIEGGYKIDFAQLPDPIPVYSSIKPNHIQANLQLEYLVLHNQDTYPAATARSSLGRGRERVDKYELNTLVYALKYIQTVDAAIGHSEDRWVLPMRDGEAHLPFQCPKHLTCLRNTKSTDDRTIVFRSFPKDYDLRNVLAPKCVCYKIATWPQFPDMTPYALAGPFFKANVELMMERLQESMGKVNLSRYSFVIENQDEGEGDEGDEGKSEDSGEDDDAEDKALQQEYLTKYENLLVAQEEFNAVSRRLLLVSSKKQKH